MGLFCRRRGLFCGKMGCFCSKTGCVRRNIYRALWRKCSALFRKETTNKPPQISACSTSVVYSGLFCKKIGLFGGIVGLFRGKIGLFNESIGLFFGKIRLFCGKRPWRSHPTSAHITSAHKCVPQPLPTAPLLTQLVVCVCVCVCV